MTERGLQRKLRQEAGQGGEGQGEQERLRSGEVTGNWIKDNTTTI